MTLFDALMVFAGMTVWITVFLFAVVNFNEFRVRLELQHHEIWKDLGSPGFTRDKGLHWPITKLLVSRRYRELDDMVLTKLGNRALAGEILMLLIFVCVAPFWVSGRIF